MDPPWHGFFFKNLLHGHTQAGAHQDPPLYRHLDPGNCPPRFIVTWGFFLVLFTPWSHPSSCPPRPSFIDTLTLTFACQDPQWYGRVFTPWSHKEYSPVGFLLFPTQNTPKPPPKHPLRSPCSVSTHTWLCFRFSKPPCFFPTFPPDFHRFQFFKRPFVGLLLSVVSHKKRAKTPEKDHYGFPQVGSTHFFALIRPRFEKSGVLGWKRAESSAMQGPGNDGQNTLWNPPQPHTVRKCSNWNSELRLACRRAPVATSPWPRHEYHTSPTTLQVS